MKPTRKVSPEGTRDTLEEGLKIDLNNLDEANQIQADLMYRVGKKMAYALSRKDKADSNLKQLKAEVDAIIRHQAARDEVKITEAEIANRILRNTKVIEAIEEFQKMKLDYDLWSELKDAFSQRGYALNNLTQLHCASYFLADKETSKRMLEERANFVREEMNRKRRSGLQERKD